MNLTFRAARADASMLRRGLSREHLKHMKVEGHVMWPSLYPESVSQNLPSEWDTISAWDPIGKVCPTIQLDSGMYFPVEARWESASHFGG